MGYMSDQGPGYVDAAVGKQLSTLRLKRGLSLEAVADHLHIAVSALKAIEAGRGRPTNDLVFAMANLYGTPVSEIFAFAQKIIP